MQRKMTFNRPFIVIGLATLAAACKPEPPAEPATAAAAAPAPAVIASAAAATNASAAPFDAKAFAGTFSGTLPCASCPGIDTRIELAADGTYRLDETYQGDKGGSSKGDGTWTAEENGKRLRLDPNSKSDDDRLFEVLSQDEIRLLDRDGKAIESALPYNLRRAIVLQ